jgi:hypothetical protein
MGDDGVEQGSLDLMGALGLGHGSSPGLNQGSGQHKARLL